MRRTPRTPTVPPLPSALADARRSQFTTKDGKYVVLSFPLRPPRLLAALTKAEREVAAAVMAGLSNAAIARARGTSARTVANQLASIFEKVGVRSRLELARALVARAPRRKR